MHANRTWIVVALAIAAVTLCCRDVLGQQPAANTRIEFKLLPPGHSLTLNDGIKVRYYKFHEYLELYKFDKELVKLRADLQDLGDINNMQKGEMKGLERIITGLKDDKELLRKRGIRLGKKLHESEEARVEAEGGPIWPYFLAIGGSLLGVAGISVALGFALAPDASP